METKYLIYRPIMGYEDSEVPYLIVGSESCAEEMRDKMIDGLKRLQKSIPKIRHDDANWHEKHLERIATIKNHKWIYGVDLSCDLSVEIDPTCVDIQDLPYYE